MLTELQYRKKSYILCREVIRRVGVPPTKNLSRTMELLALLAGIALALSPFCACAKDIKVRLVNAKTGEAFSKAKVAMFTWNGNFDIHDKVPLPHLETSDATADSEGLAVFHLPEPMPEHVGFTIGGIGDFVGCWRLVDNSPETVLRAGLVAQYDEVKCGKLRVQVTAKPGEIVIVDKKLTLWEKIRQEFP